MEQPKVVGQCSLRVLETYTATKTLKHVEKTNFSAKVKICEPLET